jgi:hypothetical protein
MCSSPIRYRCHQFGQKECRRPLRRHKSSIVSSTGAFDAYDPRSISSKILFDEIDGSPVTASEGGEASDVH